MAVSDATPDVAANYELCVWLWVTPNEHLTASTEDGCWMVRGNGAEGAFRLRIPTKKNHMPDFDHPDWPAARDALDRLRSRANRDWSIMEIYR